MTNVEALVTPRRLSRPRLLVLLVTVVAVALAGLFVFRYREARARLDGERARLAAATESLADTRTELERARRRTALTQAGVDLVLSEIELAVATRTWTEGVTRNTQREITGVEADRTETATARFLVAAHANEVRTCLDGVSMRGRSKPARRCRVLGDGAARCGRRVHPDTGLCERCAVSV